MVKKFIFLFVCLSLSLLAEEITGFWQTTNEKTHKPNSVIAVYNYKGRYFGRIIATYNKEGVMDDTIYNPKERAPGIVGKPYYCGLDIVCDVARTGDNSFKGYVIDPKGGKIYRASLWRENENLILRGKMFVFGENRTWLPFPEKDFNSTFKKPDLSSFVPVIPRVEN